MSSPYGPITLHGIKVITNNSKTKIFEASHKTFGQVIVKIYKFNHIETLSAKLKEFFFQAKLTHSCICEALDIQLAKCEDGYEVLLCMERLECDLMQEIEKRSQSSRWYTEMELWEFLRRMTSALAEAQELSTGEYKIGDFGEAKITFDATDRHSIRGTPVYMAPVLQKTLLTGDINLTHNPFRSDVFSLGMTMLSMASLHRFINVEEVKREARMQKIEELRYSPRLKGVIMRMLEEDEDNRPDFLDLRETCKVEETQARTAPVDGFLDLVKKIESAIRVSQEASTMLAACMEQLWSVSYLNKHRLRKPENDSYPHFYFKKQEMMQMLAGIPAYEQAYKVSSYSFEYIPIKELVSTIEPQNRKRLEIEKQINNSSHEIVKTIDDQVATYSVANPDGTTKFTIRRDVNLITISEPPTETPSFSHRISQISAYVISPWDIYRISNFQLIIATISATHISIEIQAPDPLLCCPPQSFTGEEITIGRHSRRTIPLADEKVSEKHAVIRCIKGVWTINDLNSRNGVWKQCHTVESKRRESNEARIEDGTEVMCGKEKYRIRLVNGRL